MPVKSLLTALILIAACPFTAPLTAHYAHCAVAPTATLQGLRPTTLPNSFTKSLAGVLNNTRIQMKLTRDGRDITGTYFYEKYKKNITLDGWIDAQGYFEIEEYDEKKNAVATFRGLFISADAMVGFWSGGTTNKPLSFQLAILGKDISTVINNLNRPSVVEAFVEDDSGVAYLQLVGGNLFGFEYENVGGNSHQCSAVAFRSTENVKWQEQGARTTITYTNEYFGATNMIANIVVDRGIDAYSINFNGDLSDFCGARAALPKKVLLSKTADKWQGKSIRE